MESDHDRLEGYHDEDPISPTPKLSLFLLPSKLHDDEHSGAAAGMLTPPIHTVASVPFKWEEAPGKPRPSCMSTQQNSNSKPKTATARRCLELPPRLLNDQAKVSNLPSPTTVLDGPYNYTLSRSLSLGKGTTTSFSRSSSSSRSEIKWVGRKLVNRTGSRDQRSIFGSSRWGSLKKKNKEVVDASEDDDDHDGDTKVKITTIRRRPSFLINFSHTRSHNLLTNIYESFKEMVPWRRRE